MRIGPTAPPAPTVVVFPGADRARVRRVSGAGLRFPVRGYERASGTIGDFASPVVCTGGLIRRG